MVWGGPRMAYLWKVDSTSYGIESIHHGYKSVSAEQAKMIRQAGSSLWMYRDSETIGNMVLYRPTPYSVNTGQEPIAVPQSDV